MAPLTKQTLLVSTKARKTHNVTEKTLSELRLSTFTGTLGSLTSGVSVLTLLRRNDGSNDFTRSASSIPNKTFDTNKRLSFSSFFRVHLFSKLSLQTLRGSYVNALLRLFSRLGKLGGRLPFVQDLVAVSYPSCVGGIFFL